MDALLSILGTIVVESGRILCGCVYPKINSLVKLQSNLDALKRDIKGLIDLKNSLKEELVSEGRNGKVATTQVNEWLREVEAIELTVNSIQAGTITNNENLRRCCLHCSLRYRLSREVEEKLKEVERLLSAGNFPRGVVAVNPPPKVVEQIPGPSIEGQTTASRNLARVLDLLKDDGVRSFGIWGMGGVGKTTLVKTLNNNLENTSLAQLFSLVLWVTVSKDLDLKRIQASIAERLKLPIIEDVQRMAIKLLETLKKERKFLLILDDIWTRIDLDEVGIPRPDVHLGSKIILTSRSLDVCREMKTDQQLKVEVLSYEESWAMFCGNAGEVADGENIKPLAEAITRECRGLPLAIITVGRAMRGKTMVELWKNALSALRRSVPDIKGIEKEVFRPLKWSYDSLEGQNTKPCFLYCSLFPEDFSIKVSELIQYWVAEGLLDEHQNFEESFNRGRALIESLIDSCLLEHGAEAGSVKMHDVVRDVAIWIASSEQGSESLVRSGMGLSQIPEGVTWKSLKRISFMKNKITSLPDSVVECSEVSTLLLQDNDPLETFPERFLQGFQALGVLNLSGTRIKSLPLSLVQLDELRALLLGDCFYLKEFPPLGGLRKLKVLDLNRTRIRELPHGIEELSNLRQLNLFGTHKLEAIRPATLSRLSGLEVLDMTSSAYKLGVQGKEKEGQVTWEDLGFLQHLVVLYVRLDNIPNLPLGYSSLLQRLLRFHIELSHPDNVCYVHGPSYKLDERKISILGPMNVSEAKLEGLLYSASDLVLIKCTGMSKMCENLARNTNVGFTGLKSLTINGCDSLAPMTGNAYAGQDILPNLEELTLYDLEFLESISELTGQLGLRFSRLRFMKVTYCPRLMYLIPGNLCQKLEKLEEIKLSRCDSLSSLFHDSIVDNAIPNLRILELEKLKSFCRWQMSWPCLEQIKVENCPLLRKLPLSTQSANALREISGELDWWNLLEWDDDHSKSSLQQYFQSKVSQPVFLAAYKHFSDTTNTKIYLRVSWLPHVQLIRMAPVIYLLCSCPSKKQYHPPEICPANTKALQWHTTDHLGWKKEIS
ncbi:hypothetical protein HHK36_005572 [Tetracentron sinense]|uniref:AAA+ ATPase domain-containing protein n=1 Tax=Tetracentron sinense TaxID=13715 RepID=A0A834ZLN9_TETSI|nr:hypothetical protein HHK36_005572 [Tetracentron sinense]